MFVCKKLYVSVTLTFTYGSPKVTFARALVSCSFILAISAVLTRPRVTRFGNYTNEIDSIYYVIRIGKG